jgi:hypothetical protein
MSSEELTYWRAYARVQPIGAAALFRAAQVVALAATAPYASKDAPPGPGAFLPDWWGDRRKEARRAERRRLRAERETRGGE